MAHPLRAAARRVPGLSSATLSARFGSLSRTTPLTAFAEGRGTAVDRWYIERFLERHREHVRGRVLEVKSDHYATALGASQVDVVDVDATNVHANVVGDLCDPTTLTTGHYDAAVITQTLQFVSAPRPALDNLLRSLRPGGVLLLTVPSLSRLCGSEDRWRWTPAGLLDDLADVVPEGSTTEVVGAGNSLVGRAFLFGLALEDLPPRAFEVDDADHPLVVCACVRLPQDGAHGS
jgi:SAM-dependent methyltransferase